MSDKTKSTQSQADSFWIRRAEGGTLPDFALRLGICDLLRETADKDLQKGGFQYFTEPDFIDNIMRPEKEINIHAKEANEQHYEVPSNAFENTLGEYMKYSCCYWEELDKYQVNDKPKSSWFSDVIKGTSGMTREFSKTKSIKDQLTEAEIKMLKKTMDTMEMKDGLNVLDVGCGWGSATFYILLNYPNSRVVSVSNSKDQQDFILKKAKAKGVEDRLLYFKTNIKDFTAEKYGSEVQKFLGKNKFDRLHSCEMFEHMRNWESLLNLLRRDWVSDKGGMFLHYFVHKSRSYPYTPDTWMGKYFFTGGIMPGFDLLAGLDQTIGKSWKIDKQEAVNGRHYAKTSEAWLKVFDEDKERIQGIFEEHYGKENANVWLNRWRMFYIAVAEFFGFREGTEWLIGHYYLKPL